MVIWAWDDGFVIKTTSCWSAAASIHGFTHTKSPIPIIGAKIKILRFAIGFEGFVLGVKYLSNDNTFLFGCFQNSNINIST